MDELAKFEDSSGRTGNLLPDGKPAFLSDSVYNNLKWTSQYLLPAIGTLYFTLALLWGLPHAQEILGTIVALNTCLGVLLGISTAQYNKSADAYDGALVVDTSDPETDRYRLILSTPTIDIPDKSSLTFKVQN